MILYHFTSTAHIPFIIAEERIRATESNVHPTIPGYGPDVVWLTDQPVIEPGSNGLGGSLVNKTEVRITVDLPLAIKWLDWTWTREMPTDWKRAFMAAAAGGDVALGASMAEHWHIWPAGVRKRFWRELSVGGELTWSSTDPVGA